MRTTCPSWPRPCKVKGEGKREKGKGKRLRPERGDGVERAERAAERERVGVGPHAQ